MSLVKEIRELAQRTKREKEDAERALAHRVFLIKVGYIKKCVEHNPDLTSITIDHFREFERIHLSDKVTDAVLKKLESEGFGVTVTKGEGIRLCVTVSWADDV